MSQRSPLNERYNSENRSGKTRRSAASAKPAAQRAATLRDPAQKTPKQKKEEQRERDRQESAKARQMASGYESTERYKKLRRYWWGFLIGAIVMTALSFLFARMDGMTQFSTVTLILAYACIIIAFWIDLGKIRKERKAYSVTAANDKSKAARKEQKKMREEARAQEREAEEKFEAAQAEKEARKKEKGGFLSRFSR